MIICEGDACAPCHFFMSVCAFNLPQHVVVAMAMAGALVALMLLLLLR